MGEGAQKGREVVYVIKELTVQKRQRVKLTIETCTVQIAVKRRIRWYEDVPCPGWEYV